MGPVPSSFYSTCLSSSPCVMTDQSFVPRKHVGMMPASELYEQTLDLAFCLLSSRNADETNYKFGLVHMYSVQPLERSAHDARAVSGSVSPLLDARLTSHRSALGGSLLQHLPSPKDLNDETAPCGGEIEVQGGKQMTNHVTDEA